MAYIKNIRIRKTISKAIEYVCDVKDIENAKDYITRGSKTQNGDLVDCNFGDWENANNLWEQTRKKYGKNDKVLAHHFIQSFDPVHKITPEEAHKIGMELAEKQFGSKGFDFIVATHIDKGHIHNHILVNNVARTGKNAGMKYYHNNNTYRYLRRLNIDTCRNNGIPAVDCKKTDEAYKKLHGIEIEDDNPIIDIGKNYQSTSYIKTPAYDSWKEEQLTDRVKVKFDINQSIKDSTSWESFLEKMNQKGYDIKWKKKDGEERKYITYTPSGAQKGVRDRHLGTLFTKEEIIKRIEYNQIKKKDQKIKNTIRQLTYNDISWNFKKSFLPLINPKYTIRKYNLKKYYIRKERYEQIISEKYYIELYKKAGLFNASSNDKKNIEGIKRFIESQNELEGIVRKYQIKDLASLSELKISLLSEISINDKRIDSLREELLSIEKKEQLVINLEKYKKSFEEYDSLEGTEKENYYGKNKINIQNYKYAEREFRKIEPDKLKEEKRKIIEKLNRTDFTNKDLRSQVNIIKRYEENINKGNEKRKDKEASR